MAKSVALAADSSRPASLLLSYIPAVCAFVAPRQPGASTAIIDRLSHSRALRALGPFPDRLRAVELGTGKDRTVELASPSQNRSDLQAERAERWMPAQRVACWGACWIQATTLLI